MHKVLYTGIGLSLFPTIACVATAASQVAPGDMPTGGIGNAHLVVLCFGLFLAGYWAVEAFSRPSVKLGAIPTPPKYMTRSTQYVLGVVMFTAISMLLYAVVAYLHREALPVIRYFIPEVYKQFQPYVEGDHPSYLLIIVLVSGAYCVLLKYESDWNVLLILRNVIQSWVAIPSMANTLLTLARDTLVVPNEGAAIVIGNPATPYVAADDFAKDRQSLDRIWAELSYMRAWLELQQSQGSHATFFSEPNFRWRELLDQYRKVIVQIAPLKKGESQDPQLFTSTFTEVNDLHDKMCRLVACYLVFKNSTQEEIFAQARAFGIHISAPRRDNPLRYAVMYVVALAISIYVGVFGWAVLYDALYGTQILPNGPKDMELVWRWVALATANTGGPICAILLAKYLGWHADPRHDQAYLVSYCWIFLAALCLAPLCLAVARIGLGIVPPPESLYSFLSMVGARFKWALGPALTCVYIAYYMDRQTDPSLPDVDQDDRTTLRRVLLAGLFAVLVLVVQLPPTMTFQPQPGKDGELPLWSKEKLQMVIMGSYFLTTLTLALVAQFGLRKLSVPRRDIATSPVRIAA